MVWTGELDVRTLTVEKLVEIDPETLRLESILAPSQDVKERIFFMALDFYLKSRVQV